MRVESWNLKKTGTRKHSPRRRSQTTRSSINGRFIGQNFARVVGQRSIRATANRFFAGVGSAREAEGDVRDLLGENIDGAIDPDGLLVGVAQEGTGEVGRILPEEELIGCRRIW